MQVRGRIHVRRPPGELRDLLLDPAVLRRCIPGCESVESAGEMTFRVSLRLGYGLIRGRLSGHVRVEEREPDRHYELTVEATGRSTTVRGRTHVELDAVDDTGTNVTYFGEAVVRGSLASIGMRLFSGAAKSFQEQFFRNLAAVIRR